MNAVLKELEKFGIVPVIKIDDAEKAVPLAKALSAGGIPCAEVTLRTAQAEEAIRRITSEVPEVLVGAGTVLTCDQVDRAVSAGARFVVSPGLNPRVVERCIEKEIPVAPGCANPSDIEAALEFGLDVVKFFPAEQAGGLEYIKAVSAPYPSLQFMPTGGINAGNIARYLAFDKILACGGSWMASADLINANAFDKITALSKEAVLNMLGFRLARIGINAEKKEEAERAANLFHSLFGFVVNDNNNSVFAGEGIDLLQTAAGVHGHIAIGTANIMRAAAYLERNGVPLNHADAKRDAKDKVIAVYLKEEILGFKVHLIQTK